MSEEKKEIEEQQEEKKDDIIERNVSLIQAENKLLKEQIEQVQEENDELKKKLAQAIDLIEQDSKAGLIAEIMKLSTMDERLLASQDAETLEVMLRHLKTAKTPVFQSGAPSPAKDTNINLNPFHENMQKWRGRQ